MKIGEIKVLVADDHDLIRQGLKRIIGFEKRITIVGEAVNGEQALAMIEMYKPDVLVLDMKMPVLDGISVLRTLKEKTLDLKIIVLTIENDYKLVQDSIDSGADGYLLKDSAGTEIVDAIITVYNNEKYIDKSLVTVLFSKIQHKEKQNSKLDILSKREIEVLYYISKGCSNKEIGEVLYISEKTVKNYATNIFRKLNVNDRVHATIFALKENIDEYYQNNIK